MRVQLGLAASGLMDNDSKRMFFNYFQMYFDNYIQRVRQVNHQQLLYNP